MKDELEKAFDRIAASAVPEQEGYTDSETGLLHCSICHTPKQCRVEIFGKTTYRLRVHFSTTNTETMNDKKHLHEKDCMLSKIFLCIIFSLRFCFPLEAS